MILALPRWRFIAPVVTGLQLASVTWVPVVHPRQHGRLGTRPPAEVLVAPWDAATLGSGSADVCWACQASPGAPGPSDARHVRAPGVACPFLRQPPDRGNALPGLGPAHWVRAPPRS
jgi:hypothetical protein